MIFVVYMILTDFQIVTAQSGHILDDDCLHIAVLDFLHHRHKTGPVEASAGNTVIGVMDDIGKVMLGSVALQVFFLIHNRIYCPQQIQRTFVKG